MTTSAFPVAFGPLIVTSIPKLVTGTVVLFTVTGRVKIISLFGEVTTVVQNVAVTLKVTANPTTGTDLDWCIATNIQALPLGSVVGLTGAFSDALVVPSLVNSGAAYGGGAPFIFDMPGTIDSVATGAATGAITWYCEYSPMSAGASVA